MKSKQQVQSDMTTYLIEHQNGKRQKVTVPSSWKVTFGPAVAGGNKTRESNLKMPTALRFYEAENKQRAIFTDVIAFRDLSIKVEEERINVQEKQGYVECDGKRKSTTFQAKTTEWFNPDQAGDLKLLSPSDDIE